MHQVFLSVKQSDVFGNFVNVEVYGGETNSLFGMSINGAAPVHPLFLYESIWNVIGLVILLLIRDKKKNDGRYFVSIFSGIHSADCFLKV